MCSDDAALLAQHAAGDPRAFASLYAKYINHLTREARRQGCPEPEDAAQEALARAANKANTYPGPGTCSVSTWLHRILRNTVIDMWRARQARPTVPMADRDPASVVPDFETARQVRMVLATLPAEQAEVLELHYCVGLTAVEISSQLHVNENTVKARVRLGAKKLRDAMTERTDFHV